MSFRVSAALTALLLIPMACAQADTAQYEAPERGDPGLNTESDAAGRDFRNVFIAPADLSDIRIIQPEGAEPDAEWKLSDIEDGNLQRALVTEFAATLSLQSAFNIVPTKEQSEVTIHTTIVAIHPHANRAEIAAGAGSGGAVTASIALVNTRSGEVMVRSVDTRSSDDIWAFNQVGSDDPAINLIFRSWGNSIRRGMLHLQGRTTDPLALPGQLKEQQ